MKEQLVDQFQAEQFQELLRAGTGSHLCTYTYICLYVYGSGSGSGCVLYVHLGNDL